MDSRFAVPVLSMLIGLGLWLIYFIARALSRAVKGWPPRAELTIALAIGAIIVFSGFT